MSQNEFNPLAWPPDMKMAQLHFDCCKPGIDNPEGPRCQCCNRSQKLANSRWPSRDITKDFGNYGGGVPSYFYLMKYLMVVFILLCGLKVVYHIMLLYQVCPTLDGTKERCALVFGIFYFCDMEILYSKLVSQGNISQANTLEYLQLATYIFLVIATLGIKIFLHILNQRTTLDQKLFSRFSLIIKNIPLYFQIQDIKEQLKKIEPNLVIAQIFFLHKTCECERLLRSLVDMHFAMKNVEAKLAQDPNEKLQKQYFKMKQQYLKDFDLYEKEYSNLKASSKKVIVVFNTIEQKQKVHKALKMNELAKFCFYMGKLFGRKNDSVGYYSERMAEPQEIYWKYIGQGSTKKQKMRIQTTIIGFIIILISFAVFYFPLLKIDKEKILDPGLGTALGMVISFVVFLMIFTYRAVITAMMPTRRPSSKLAQAYFVVIALAIFFFCFYLVSPALFYVFTTSIPSNYKLAEFFMAVLIFCVGNIVIAILDIGYLFYNMKKKKLMNQKAEADNYCQGRLHEEITPPPFPVPFKLVIAFNMWSFNSYYIFNIPYLVGIFFITLLVLYWIDKYILYNHYKMQSYLSMELEHQTQKIILVVFLACVSLGYLTIATFEWEKWLILFVFGVAIIINFALQFIFKRQKDQIIKLNTDLKTALEKCRSDVKVTNLMNIMETDLKASFMLNDPKDLALELSQASLATAIVFYGYQQTYNLYLSQFHRKQVNQLIEQRFFELKKTHSSLSARESRYRESNSARPKESELSRLVGGSLHQKLIEAADNQSEKSQKKESNYVPPEHTPVKDTDQGAPIPVQEPLKGEKSDEEAPFVKTEDKRQDDKAQSDRSP